MALDRASKLIGCLFLALAVWVLMQPGSWIRTWFDAWRLSRSVQETLADSSFTGSMVMRRVGAENPRELLLVVTDYRCPYCRMLHDSLPSLLGGRQQRAVQLLFKPRDIEGREAALSAICAARQGALSEMDRYLFGSDGQVQGIEWRRVADSLLIPDPGEFETCRLSSSARDELRLDSLLLDRLHVTGTPAFLSRGRGLHVGLLSNAELNDWFDPELSR